MTAIGRRRIELKGIVQGVGMRPAVDRLATSLGLAGFVGNDGAGLFVEVEGPTAALDAFVDGLVAGAPPMAWIESLRTTVLAPEGSSGFRIVESVRGGDRTVAVAPDAGPCRDCLAELADPTDRRFRYPFVNCTNCGPRYSIVVDLPYDRPSTTMASFPLCAACASEYRDPDDRRYHAQPTCCPACGPHLTLRDADFAPVIGPGDDEAVLAELCRWLDDGRIVAIKGLGGYHLAVDAASHGAVTRLRARKHRAEKPFAVLAADLREVERMAVLDTAERDLLAGPERPIVLVEKRPGAPGIAEAVAPANRALGIMLPPTPLHVLLAQDFGRPLVLTSANRSDEPIVHVDEEAPERLREIADGYCSHDRPIHVRIDDSVTRLVAGRQVIGRRARGHAPRPVTIEGGVPRPLLACGAHLKATICVARGTHAYVSQHLGDLDDLAARTAYVEAVAHMCSLFGVEPEVVVHDLHPDMASTAFADDFADAHGIEPVAVQHHHAHIAACLADNNRAHDVLGVAFDGLGFGTDGGIWGGEFLRADLAGFERLGHLAPVPMPGGDRATREPWRMAAAYLRDPSGHEPQHPAVRARHRDEWDVVVAMCAAGVNAPPTTSAGRLFDAVASILGVRDAISYEGQAAIELEQSAGRLPASGHRFSIEDGEPFVIDTGPLVHAVAAAHAGGLPLADNAARFHRSVVDLVVAGCRLGRERTGLNTVALSGGVFQNAILVGALVADLGGAGFEVLTHRRFPPNDGGISLGQVVVAAARDRRRSR